MNQGHEYFDWAMCKPQLIKIGEWNEPRWKESIGIGLASVVTQNSCEMRMLMTSMQLRRIFNVSIKVRLAWNLNGVIWRTVLIYETVPRSNLSHTLMTESSLLKNLLKLAIVLLNSDEFQLMFAIQCSIYALLWTKSAKYSILFIQKDVLWFGDHNKNVSV